MADGLVILRRLRAMKFTVQAVGDRVRVLYPAPRPPAEAMPLIEEGRRRKQEILEALQRLCPDCLGEDWVWDVSGTRLCRRCRKVAAEVKRIEAPPPWRDCTPNEAREELAQYKEGGWVAIFSEVLQEPIVLARNDDVAKGAPAGFVTYTEAEVARLSGLRPEDLRQVHEVKRYFGGHVVKKEVA